MTMAAHRNKTHDQYQMYSSGNICIANQDFSNGQDKPLFSKGDILTIVNYKSEDGGTCTVVCPDGIQRCVPTNYLKMRSPVDFSTLSYFHKNATIEDADKLLSKKGQFMVVAHDNGGYCICQRCEDVVKIFVVAIDVNNQLTIDGTECFTSLPALIEFYQNIEPHSNNRLVPTLGEPVPVSEISNALEFIDHEALNNVWGLPLESIEKTKVIGKGEFGEVYSGCYRGNYQIAIKTLSPTVTSISRESLIKEASIMTHLRHKNLVQLVGVVFDENSLQMITMELMSRGSLGKYLITRGRSVVSQKEQIKYARDICEGMLYFSGCGFVHRDLAARNVLLNDKGIAKVSDFGLSRRANIHIPNEVGKFPVRWTAPEALKDKKFSEKSDVWSFGVLLWEIFSFGRIPYPNIHGDELLEYLEDGEVMEPPEGCLDAIYDIMTECWALGPNERPTFEVVQKMLSNSFGESRTPCSSPKPVRTAFAKLKTQAQQLLNTPIASNIYEQSLNSDDLCTTVNIANVIAVGPAGSGKTSLMRRIQGEQFRLAEQSTQDVVFHDKLCEVSNNSPWVCRDDDCVGMSHSNELARSIASQLIDHAKVSSPTSTCDSYLPSSPPHKPLLLINTHKPIPYISQPSEPHSPELPGVADRKRSSSFSFSSATLPPSRNACMSMVIEDVKTPPPAISFDITGSQPEGLNHTQSNSLPPRKGSIKRALSFSVFRRASNKREKKSNHNPTNNNTYLKPNSIRVERKESPLLASKNAHSPLLATPPSSPPTLAQFELAIPIKLADKIKNKLNDCVSDSGLPPEMYVRLIDTPGTNLPDTITMSSLVTPSSIILAVLDASNNNQTQVEELVCRVNILLCKLKSGGSGIKPTVVLIGTHTDNTTVVNAKRFIADAHSSLKDTVGAEYVSTDFFFVSNLSIMDQSSIDAIKTFISKLIASSYSRSIPLKWLQSVTKLKSFSQNNQYILSLDEFRSPFKEIDDFNSFFAFLQSNHMVLTFGHIPALKGIVVTDVSWFIDKLNRLLSLGHPTSAPPTHISNDIEVIKSQGLLSQFLMNYIWPNCSKSLQKEILFVFHQLELLGLSNASTTPISPCDSQHSIQSTSSSATPTSTNATPTKSVNSKVIIPCLVREKMPDNIRSGSSIALEPFHFKFSVQFMPFELLHKLLTRCLYCYNHTDSMIYSDGACLIIDNYTSLVIHRSHDNVITINLHHTHRSPIPFSYDVACHPLLPSKEVANTTLMFIRASLSDIISTWLNDLVEYQLCLSCYGKDDDSVTPHLVPLTEHIDRYVNESLPLYCEEDGLSMVIPDAALPWFGRDPPVTDIDADVLGNDSDRIMKEDILMIRSLDKAALEAINGLISENSTFFDLITALESTGRQELANALIDVRMKTTGLSV